MGWGDDEDEDDDGQNLLLLVMEVLLKLQVLEMLEFIVQGYEELLYMQDNCMLVMLNEDGIFLVVQEIVYQYLCLCIVVLVNELYLYNNWIEVLVDQIYGINCCIVIIDFGMVKLVDVVCINCCEFIDVYCGVELDLIWVDCMLVNKGCGWQSLFEKLCLQVENLCSDMVMILQCVGVDIEEFCRIVNQVQCGEKEVCQVKKEMVEVNLCLVILIVKKYMNRGL